VGRQLNVTQLEPTAAYRLGVHIGGRLRISRKVPRQDNLQWPSDLLEILAQGWTISSKARWEVSSKWLTVGV
jgi:hypothetical protein